MNEKTFKNYMVAAQTMQVTNQDFWLAYMRGLRRLYHGERFGTDAEHEQWMSCGMVEIGDPIKVQICPLKYLYPKPDQAIA